MRIVYTGDRTDGVVTAGGIHLPPGKSVSVPAAIGRALVRRPDINHYRARRDDNDNPKGGSK